MHIGIDLGGTKIAALAMATDGRELERRRVRTPRGDYGAILKAIGGLVDELERTHGRALSVGVGTPGSLSPASGLIRNSNSTVLNGKPLDRDLGHVLGRVVRLANDADCFALSEATDGAGAGAGTVFGVIVGTGTGAGIVVRGQLLHGPNAIAGEWGHNPLPWPDDDERPGRECYCGGRGCIETWLSGPGVAADHLEITGQRLDPVAIAERAAAGDPSCLATLSRHAGRMARALASVVNVLDPDVIILGGGVGKLEGLYRQVPALWDRWIFSDVVRTRLLPPRFGDDSGLRGAAWLGA